ncbi:retrovirus-related pol polyprotein from transposon TNT 1-94 [Tanacetum coccineum]|uniref:Retrovirus-related pol polyprotein from transposon TNT 1-94 n=1 Tax=Tanacetum coccineum TaxID=301880 RepID=A0ABQ4X6G9_9ASTR
MENIKCLNKTSTTNSVKKDIDEIEIINIELEHRVTKLIAENEHLKLTYKQLYDLIKPSRVWAKEHAESLVNQLNQKSVEIIDLNAQLQEKVFVITTLKNDLRNQGKDISDMLLLGYVRDTCPDIHKPCEKLVAVTPINKKKTVRFDELVISSSTSQKQLGSSQTKTKQTTNNFVSISTGVGRSTKSSRSKSTDNKKNDRTQQISSRTQKKDKVEDHSRIVKSSLNKKNCVVEPSGNANVEHSKFITNYELMCVKCNSSMFNARHELCFLEFISDMNASSKSKSVKKAKKKEEWKPTGKVVQIVLWYLDSRCSKHMTGDRSQLTNFVYKFLGTVKLGNDQIAKIMGYGDYQIGNITISRVYYVEGLGHNLFSVEYYEQVGNSHETSVAQTPQQNGVVKRRNRALVEAARTMLIFAQAPLFLWAEEIATACYTQNQSIIRRCHGKTPYELLHDRKPDLSYLHVFGALCYPNNDNENLGKLQAKNDIGIFIGYTPKKKAYRIYNRRTRIIIETIHVDFDELTTMASEQLSSGPELQCMTPATSSSGLVPNSIPQQPCILPPRDDWDRLFQPMFYEYFNPTTITISLVPVADAPRAVDLADSPVFTSIDQDAPSTSIPSSKEQVHSPIISQGFEESPKMSHFHDDPSHESLHEDSTSQ